MEISNEAIKIKKVEYELRLSTLLTKKKNWNEKVPKKNKFATIPNLSKEDWKNCNYAEIVWRNGVYWFCYSVSVPEKDTSSYAFKAAGGELDEIHSATVATEDQALLISGRAMRSISHFRAKVLADLSKKMSRCKKGSRQWKKYRQARV
ncbi:hypothetical protein [Peribacillus loiseleuriae]|uniref:hypothetical protein n=1 Tax=Peribacillus loiseleuriae TaxID=1679170 RepID=UPI000A7BABA4|nr:hypothetical protein [Peribacillus loiseleuriae]